MQTEQGDAYYLIVCPPGSCSLVATVKLDAGNVWVNGDKQDMRPVIRVWEVMTPNGSEWRLGYAYDPIEHKHVRDWPAMAAAILPDGTFPRIFDLTCVIGLSPENAADSSYYAWLLVHSEYANIVSLASQWHTTKIMPPELENLIIYEHGFDMQ